jgi:hypothetical protein
MILVNNARTRVQNKNLINLAACHVIELADLKLIPLSTQLRRITGDTYNVIDFVNENGEGLNAAAGNIIRHVHSGLRFLIA